MPISIIGVLWLLAMSGLGLYGIMLAFHHAARLLGDRKAEARARRECLHPGGDRVDRGDVPIAEICMLKNQATQTVEFCAKEAVQILGGAGYIRGAKSERIYRETKVLAIGGGAEEIMKDLAARQLGF